MADELERGMRRGKLPDRVLAYLRTHGDDYARSIAQALGAREAAVTQVLRTLSKRGVVERANRIGHCVYYSAVDDALEDGAQEDAAPPSNRQPERRPTARAPVDQPEHEPAARALSALTIDVLLERAAAPAIEIEALLYANRGVRGL